MHKHSVRSLRVSVGTVAQAGDPPHTCLHTPAHAMHPVECVATVASEWLEFLAKLPEIPKHPVAHMVFGERDRARLSALPRDPL